MDEDSDELMRRRVMGSMERNRVDSRDKMKHMESNDQFHVTEMTLVAEQVTRDED